MRAAYAVGGVDRRYGISLPANAIKTISTTLDTVLLWKRAVVEHGSEDVHSGLRERKSGAKSKHSPQSTQYPHPSIDDSFLTRPSDTLHMCIPPSMYYLAWSSATRPTPVPPLLRPHPVFIYAHSPLSHAHARECLCLSPSLGDVLSRSVLQPYIWHTTRLPPKSHPVKQSKAKQLPRKPHGKKT